MHPATLLTRHPQVLVLNGDKHRELCPEHGQLSPAQLAALVVRPKDNRPLLRREAAGVQLTSDDGRVLLPFDTGVAVLSDYQCTTSSEALLAGRQPTFK